MPSKMPCVIRPIATLAICVMRAIASVFPVASDDQPSARRPFVRCNIFIQTQGLQSRLQFLQQ
jgi:hypothetical protein